jgi:hypothetical protein
MEEEIVIIKEVDNIKEGYIPENGLGKILTDPEIKELALLPSVKFFPKTEEPIVRYNIYNVMKESVHFLEGFVDGSCVLLFSAFIKDLSTISVNDCIRSPIRFPPITEKIKIRVRLDRKFKRYKPANESDLNSEEKEFVLNLEQNVLVDPMTNVLLDGCSLTFVPAHGTLYRIGWICIQEEIAEIEDPAIVKRRKDAILRTNGYFNKQKEAEEPKPQETTSLETQIEKLSLKDENNNNT